VNFIGVAARDDLEPMREFVAQHDLPFVQIADFDQTIWTEWGVVTQPAFVFIDDTDPPVGHLGALGAEQLRERLDALG